MVKGKKILEPKPPDKIFYSEIQYNLIIQSI